MTGLQIGLLYSFQAPARFGATAARTYPELVDEIAWVDAELEGISSVWLTEHHGFPDDYLPSPMMAAAAIAARTRRLRICQGIVLLPLYGHPLRLAEDTAVVDVLSSGRFELGVGMGYRQDEFDAFGVSLPSRRRRFEEGLDIFDAALSGERFDYAGRHYQVTGGLLRPAPVQQPLPLWLGAATPTSRKRAAERGANLLISLLTDRSHTRAQFADFRAAGGQGRTALIREAWIGPFDEVAPYLSYTYQEVYAPPHATFVERLPDGSRRTITDPDDPFYRSEQFWKDRFIIGDPATCAEEIRRYRDDLGIDELVLRLAHPGMDADMRRRALRTLIDDVLPRV